MLVIRTYSYKLYHTKKFKYLDEILYISSEIYNYCLRLHKRYYKIYNKYLDRFKLQKHLTKVKKSKKYSHWKKVPSQAIQNIVERIDKAYKLFFRNIKHGIKSSPPKFKKYHKYKSFTLIQAGYKIENNTIRIRDKFFKFWNSRPIDGKIKTITVKRNTLGEYFIFITVEKEMPEVNITSGKIVGIDFGLKTFLTLSTGEKIVSPRYYEKSLKELKKLHKKLSKQIKGSNNYKRTLRKLRKLYIKISNQRKDFFHKLSNYLTSKFDFIAVEDLNIKAMQQLWGRKISDYAFSEFLQILEYKANVVKIDRFYPSSKTCSNCGHVYEDLKLRDRKWRCPVCGTLHLRDLNASINICRVGASILGTEDISLEINSSYPCFKAEAPELKSESSVFSHGE